MKRKIFLGQRTEKEEYIAKQEKERILSCKRSNKIVLGR
jgi:hypothetical protein